jgi:hypothetical protein
MYDLTNGESDRGGAKCAALSRVCRPGVIGRRGPPIGWRGPKLGLLGLVIAAGSGCPARVVGPRVAEAVEAPVTEVWVDGSAAAGGSGSSDQPLRDLKAALAPGSLIHLAPGIYAGPITLPDGAALISKKGLGVITLDGPGAVVTAGRARLEGVAIQGGEVGLLARGQVTLKDVRLSGQRALAVRVESPGVLFGEGLEVVGVIAGIDGVQANPGTKVSLKGARFSGGLRRAIDALDAEIELDDAMSMGAKEQLHLEGGRATVTSSSSLGGSGPAWFVARAAFRGEGLTVRGHEYGVLSGNNSALQLQRLDVRGPQLAALGLVKSKVELHDATLEGGAYAAVQLLECESHLDGVEVTSARANAVVVRLGKARIERLTVRRVAAESDSDEGGGDGLHLRGGQVELREVLVQNCSGAAVLATAQAKVTIERLGADRCRAGAAVVELGANVEATGVVVKDPFGPALTVPDASTLKVTDLVLSGADVPVWAECDAGAKVTLSGIQGMASWRAPHCVSIKAR